MSQNNFHTLYVAPLIVAILATIIAAIGTYYFSPMPAQPPTQLPALQLPRESLPSVNEVEFPKDAATQDLLQAFLADPAAAAAKYQGKEVQIRSVIAIVDPSGSVELYGAISKNQVEGIYFECRLQNKSDASLLERNHLVAMKGTIRSYVHHRRSPHILLESCCLLRPELPHP